MQTFKMVLFESTDVVVVISLIFWKLHEKLAVPGSYKLLHLH